MRLHVSDIVQSNDQAHRAEKSSSICGSSRESGLGSAPRTDVEEGTIAPHQVNRAL